MSWCAFPLHPETPPEGRSLEDLFAGRNVDIPGVLAHLKQVAAAEGLPFGDRAMTYNSRSAQELGKWAEQEGRGEAFHGAVFRAYFAEGRNIAEEGVLLDVAASVSLDRDEARRVIHDGVFKAAVDADWRRSAERGVTAVPTFFMGSRRLVGAQSYQALEKFVQA